MTFSVANNADITGLKKLWSECFTDDLLYLDRFFINAFPLTKTYIVTDGESSEIVASLSVFHIEYLSTNNSPIPGGYLYGVCTSPLHRGKNLSSLLLDYAKKDLQDDGLYFLITRPASRSLFELYKKQGFASSLYLQSITFPISDLSPSPIFTERLSSEELNILRESHLSLKNTPFIRWDNDSLKYIIADIIYRDGSVFKYRDYYCVCYPEYDSPETITIIETSFPETLHEILFLHIKSIYPEATSLNLIRPSSSREGVLESFLALSITEDDFANTLEIENCYFNFPME